MAKRAPVQTDAKSRLIAEYITRFQLVTRGGLYIDGFAAPDRFAIEVPDIEKRRGGLDPHLRLWVVTDEANTDLPDRSFYFEPDGRMGAFSLQFAKAVQARMIQALQARKLKSVNRR